MTMSSTQVYNAGDVLTADSLTKHVTESTPTALSAAMSAAGFDITALDELAFTDAAAGATVGGRIRRNGVNLEWHNGTASGRLFFAGGVDVPVADGGTGLSAGTSGGVPYFSGATTVASSAALTQNGVVYGGGAGAAPAATAQGGTNTILTASAGAPAFSATPIVNTSVQIGVASTATGSLALAHASSANLTTIQAGNATEANTYVWPADGGAANQVLTTDGATPTTALSWATISSPSAASQAEMEAASSTTVYASPGRTKYHPGVAKFFTHHDSGGGDVESYNVTSVTDTGTGDHTINLTTAFTDTNAGCFATSIEDNTTQILANVDHTAAGTVRLRYRNTATPFALTDPPGGNWNALGFGDQA